MVLLEWLRSLYEAVRLYFLHYATYEELTDFETLTLFTGNELSRVYNTITTALGLLSLGYGLDLIWGFGGLLTTVGFVGMYAWFCLTPTCREGRRICLLMVAAFLLGASMYGMITYCLFKIRDMIGHDQGGSLLFRLINLFFTIDRSYLLKAFVAIALVFGSFASVVSCSIEERPRRWMIYGICALVSAVVLWSWLDLCEASPDNVQKLYLFTGFSYFILYVAAYSQEIVVQVSLGNTFCTQHAIALFTQMPAFLFHIVYCFVWRRRRANMPNGVVH